VVLVNSASAKLFRRARREPAFAPNMGSIMPDLGMGVSARCGEVAFRQGLDLDVQRGRVLPEGANGNGGDRKIEANIEAPKALRHNHVTV